jgi:hemerythrin
MDNDIIEWDNRYAVGIEQIDNQHRELLKMANNLCLGTIREVISFMRHHFLTEEELLDHIHYPDIAAHKQQHSNFAKEVFDKVDQLEAAQQPFSQNFTQHLRNMIITHITLTDKKYATYINILNHNAELQSREYSLPTELFLG